jgi:hypothetical protein
MQNALLSLKICEFHRSNYKKIFKNRFLRISNVLKDANFIDDGLFASYTIKAPKETGGVDAK